VDRYNGGAVTCYVVGGFAMAAGVTLWILSPGDETWAREHKVALMPSIVPGIGQLMLTGRW
jgi:hypothetical protein